MCKDMSVLKFGIAIMVTTLYIFKTDQLTKYMFSIDLFVYIFHRQLDVCRSTDPIMCKDMYVLKLGIAIMLIRLYI